MGCELKFNNKEINNKEMKGGKYPFNPNDEVGLDAFKENYEDVIELYGYTEEMLQSGDGAPKIVYEGRIPRCEGYDNGGCLKCPHDLSC